MPWSLNKFGDEDLNYEYILQIVLLFLPLNTVLTGFVRYIITKQIIYMKRFQIKIPSVKALHFQMLKNSRILIVFGRYEKTDEIR